MMKSAYCELRKFIALQSGIFIFFASTCLATRKRIMGLAFGLFGTLLISACQVIPEQLNEATPTPPIQQEVEASSQESDSPIPTPTKIPPVRFTIPTPGAEPVSDWRPPLYPIPWAISPEDHFYFVRPIAANEINWPLQSYRYGGIFFNNVVHTGIDIPTEKGTPIIAAGPGTVVWANWGFFSGWVENKDDPYGQAVAIEHDFGYEGQPLYTVYAHMSQIDVVKGQWVDVGEEIGLVGETGHTTGPHLHFEVRKGGYDHENVIDPYKEGLWE